MANKKTKKRGLGSPNMDEETKHDIQSKGGKASHGGQDENQDENVMMEDEEVYQELRMPKSQDDTMTTTQEDAGLAEELDPGMDLTEDWDEDEAV